LARKNKRKYFDKRYKYDEDHSMFSDEEDSTTDEE
jgi:hypothetical protein